MNNSAALTVSSSKTHEKRLETVKTAVLDSSTPSHWDHVKDVLLKEIGGAAFRNWVAPLTVRAINSGVLELHVPTRFMKDWVSSHYADRIRAVWMRDFPGEISDLELIINPSALNSKPAANDALPKPATVPASVKAETGFSLDAVSSPLDSRFTFANFVTGKTNELAHAAALRVAENRETGFNPLFLYGACGLGKTHLMHATAQAIRESDPTRKVLYLSAEKFMYQFIRALRFKDTASFKDMFRSVDVLMIDDVQFISGKESTQEEFFHTFNALVDQNRQIIISADKSPPDLDGIGERLRSRLGGGLVADIQPATYDLRLGILTRRCENMQRAVPQDVLEFLAHKITSNIRELEGALNRIIATSDLVGRAITLDSTQDILRDLLRANVRNLTIEDIQKKVAEHYGIRMADMHSPRRSRVVARPRQVAMYLAKQLTECSLPEIGRKFGGRDHTTVIHGVRKIEELLPSERNLLDDIEIMRRELVG